MTVESLIISILSMLGVSGIISGIVISFIRKRFNKSEELSKKRAEEAAERDKKALEEKVLIIKSHNATGNLTEELAVALIREGSTNGEVDLALKCYRSARDELYNFLVEQNAAVNH